MGIIHSSACDRNTPPTSLIDAESVMKDETTPHFDAHPADDQQRHEGHVLACGSYPQSVDDEIPLPSEEVAGASMQISCHGSLSGQTCDVHPPCLTEQPWEYINMILRQLDFEKERTRLMETREQKMTNLLHGFGFEDVEAMADTLQKYYGETMHRRKETVEYRKLCKDLSSKIEQLEHLHSQKAMADSGSYQDSAATPPLLQTAADGVNDAIVVCASEFFSRLKKDANIVSNFNVKLDIPIGQNSPSNVKVALQALLCRIVFKGFENPYFSLTDSLIPPFEIPSKRKSQLFQAFRRCRDREARQLLHEDNDFKHFVHAKAYKVCEEIKLRLQSAEVQDGEFTNLELLNENDSNLHCKFLRLSKAVWVLHKLALAFEPSAEIFHVGRSSSFNEMFMEDIAHDEDEEEYESMVHMKPHKQVRFMRVPGFTVRHTVIKSRVFCSPDVQPQACSVVQNDPSSMVVDDE